MGEMERYRARNQTSIFKRQSSQIKSIIEETDAAMIMVDGVEFVSSRAMMRMTELDEERKRLAAGDPTLNGLLGQIELGAVSKMVRIQNRLYE